MFGIIKKAGWSGLFLLAASSIATAEPLALQVLRAGIVTQQRTGHTEINIVFAEAGKEALGRFTSDNIGRKMELRIDGKVMIRAVLREPIIAGSVYISGVAIEEMRALADRISAGSAEVQIEIVPE